MPGHQPIHTEPTDSIHEDKNAPRDVVTSIRRRQSAGRETRPANVFSFDYTKNRNVTMMKIGIRMPPEYSM